MRVNECGHDDRKHEALGMCKYCYNSHNRRNHPRRTLKYKLFSKYKITLEEYDELASSQGYCCMICGVSQENNLHGRLYVDHDEDTGAVRGLLCLSCNTGIGSLKHDKALLTRAIEYLDSDIRKVLSCVKS